LEAAVEYLAVAVQVGDNDNRLLTETAGRAPDRYGVKVARPVAENEA
jgi:hypothetical protein